MALIANGRDPSYTEIAPGMYRNADGWTVFRVNLSDYTAKGYGVIMIQLICLP